MISSINVTISFPKIDMIMNIVKYDTNKRWVIHNLNQQDVGNPQFLENFSFSHSTFLKISLKWFIEEKIDIDLM